MSEGQGSSLAGPVAFKLQNMIKRVRAIIIRRAILATLAAMLGCMLVVMAVELAVPRMSELLRWLLTLSIPVSGVAAAWRYGVRPLRRPITIERMARVIETRHPELHERLSSTVELSARGREGQVSRQLLEALARDSAVEAVKIIPQTEFSVALVKRWLIAPSVCLAVLALAAALWPRSTFRLFVRTVAPSAQMGNLYAGRMTIKPGDVRIAIGDPLVIDMLTSDAALKPVYLESTTGQGRTEERMALMSETNDAVLHYSLTLPEVNSAFSYRILAGYAESDRFQVRVEPRPALSNTLVRYQLPPYTGLPPKVETNSTGNIRSIAGTVVTVETVATKPVSNMTMRVGSRPAVRGRPSGILPSASWQWTIQLATNMAGPYVVEMVDEWGFTGEPVTRTIEVTVDDPPTVRVVAPEGDPIHVKPTELVKVVGAGLDDFGLSKAEMVVTVERDQPVVTPVGTLQPVSDPVGGYVVASSVDLSTFRLSGRKALKMMIRVYDNRSSEYGGAQVGVSPALNLVIDEEAASLVKQALDAQVQGATEQMNALSALVHDAEMSAEKVSQAYASQKGMSPEAQAALEAAREKATAAEAMAQSLANAVANTPLAALRAPLEKLAAGTLEAARQSAESLPLSEAGKQEVQSAQLAQTLQQADSQMTALAQQMQQAEQGVAALEKLADLANRQQQLANQANAAAAQAPEQRMGEAFKKDEAAVAGALKGDLAGPAQEAPGEGLPQGVKEGEKVAAQAAEAAAQAGHAKEAAPQATRAAQALANAVTELANQMAGAPANPDSAAQGQPADQQGAQGPQQAAQNSPANAAKGQPSKGTPASPQPSSQMGMPSAAGQPSTPPGELASLGVLGLPGTATLNWTKAKGLSRSKVGGENGLRVPPEYREIVGRYFEELSRVGATGRK